MLLSPAAFEQMRDVVARHASVPAYVVPQAVMDGLVGFNMHRGCLALARRPSVPALTRTTPFSARVGSIVLEGVNNPDNVGGIFRSAAAFGADLVAARPRVRRPALPEVGAHVDGGHAGRAVRLGAPTGRPRWSAA